MKKIIVIILFLLLSLSSCGTYKDVTDGKIRKQEDVEKVEYGFWTIGDMSALNAKDALNELSLMNNITFLIPDFSNFNQIYQDNDQISIYSSIYNFNKYGYKQKLDITKKEFLVYRKNIIIRDNLLNEKVDLSIVFKNKIDLDSNIIEQNAIKYVKNEHDSYYRYYYKDKEFLTLNVTYLDENLNNELIEEIVNYIQNNLILISRDSK